MLCHTTNRWISQSVRLTRDTAGKRSHCVACTFRKGNTPKRSWCLAYMVPIFNVAVDLRPGETFGHAYSAVLSFENRKQMLIPRGFAHGYLTLEDDTLMQWCVDNDFCGEAAKAVRYDSDFVWEGESWPEAEYIISEKDRNAVRLENFCVR